MTQDNEQTTTQSTESASMTAAGRGTDVPGQGRSGADARTDRPTAGEQDGRFYFTKNVMGDEDSEIPDATHEDNAAEVRLQATNQGWNPVDESYLVDQAQNMGDHWVVLYSVPVVRNQIDIP